MIPTVKSIALWIARAAIVCLREILLWVFFNVCYAYNRVIEVNDLPFTTVNLTRLCGVPHSKDASTNYDHNDVYREVPCADLIQFEEYEDREVVLHEGGDLNSTGVKTSLTTNTSVQTFIDENQGRNDSADNTLDDVAFQQLDCLRENEMPQFDKNEETKKFEGDIAIAIPDEENVYGERGTDSIYSEERSDYYATKTPHVNNSTGENDPRNGSVEVNLHDPNTCANREQIVNECVDFVALRDDGDKYLNAESKFLVESDVAFEMLLQEGIEWYSKVNEWMKWNPADNVEETLNEGKSLLHTWTIRPKEKAIILAESEATRRDTNDEMYSSKGAKPKNVIRKSKIQQDYLDGEPLSFTDSFVTEKPSQLQERCQPVNFCHQTDEVSDRENYWKSAFDAPEQEKGVEQERSFSPCYDFQVPDRERYLKDAFDTLERRVQGLLQKEPAHASKNKEPKRRVHFRPEVKKCSYEPSLSVTENDILNSQLEFVELAKEKPKRRLSRRNRQPADQRKLDEQGKDNRKGIAEHRYTSTGHVAEDGSHGKAHDPMRKLKKRLSSSYKSLKSHSKALVVKLSKKKDK